MKIAVFYNIDFSGAKRVVKEHVKGLKQHGHAVDLYTTDEAFDIFHPKPYSDKTFIYSFSPFVINLPVLRRVKSDFIDTFILLRRLHEKIARDIDNNRYDLVLVHTDIYTQAPFLLRFLKTKNVYYCLEPLRNAYEYSLRLKSGNLLNKLYENLNRWIRKRIDLKNVLSTNELLTISLFSRERIIAAYDRIAEVSYIGVDENIFKPVKVNKKNQVLFVADKDPIYGYDLAEKAINLIPTEFRPTLKVITWKKENSQRLSDKELIMTYNESLVTLSLSKLDTFGLVSLESLSCGVPVIALNVAGYREIIEDGKSGFLVYFRPEEIAEKILFFIKNKEAAEKMAIESRKIILAKWKWQSLIKKLDNKLRILSK